MQRHLVQLRRAATTGAVVLCAAATAAAVLPSAAAADPPPRGPGQEIARGTAVPDGGYPWAVSLHTGSSPSTGNTLCSGSHIAPEWILTAQHCFDHDLNGTIGTGELNASDVWVSLNRTKISTTSRGEVIRGAGVALYKYNDLALLRLATPSSAPTVQLASVSPAVGTNITTAGWGLVNATTLPDNMQQGQFRISGKNSLDLGYVPRNTEEMCGGDSGGPVFTQSGGRTLLVGVHTNSPTGCGVNTGTAVGSRVDQAFWWIKWYVRPAYGFALSHAASTPAYTPSALYSHNSTGGTNTVARLGVGTYRVDMPGLGQSNGNVQVTSFGVTTNRCKSLTVSPSGTTQRIFVRCFTPAGALADTRFVAQYYRAGVTTAQNAYLLATLPTATSAYYAHASYSHNSAGGRNVVRRLSTGVYQAYLPGMSLPGGNVHVTGHGLGAQYCKVQGWSTGTLVTVRCFNSWGAPSDSQFSLRYTRNAVANAGQKGAYVLAHNALSTSWYVPSATYRYHSGGSGISAVRVGTGTYRVYLPSLPSSNRTSPMVTAAGANNVSCNVAGWGAGGTGTLATVQCRAGTGPLWNSAFTLSYTTNR